MKRVAIIGAGSSGMACACRLEQLGFEGRIDIYEEKNNPWDGNMHAMLIAEFINRPIKDTLESLSQRHGIHIEPASTIYHSINHGPTTIAEFSGFLGYIALRGGHPESIENQMRNQIKSAIHFGQKVFLKDIQNAYDAIVLATGNWDSIPEIVKFRIEARVSFHYAIIGEKDLKLDPSQMEMWFDTRYAPWGYAYRIPVIDKKAMIACTGVMSSDNDPVEEGWEVFKKEHIEGKYEILEEHHILKYLLGRPDRIRVGNVYLIGANVCCNNPLFGFGQFQSLLSGIYAADAIALEESYEDKMSFITDEHKKGVSMFKRIHAFGNTGYDMLIRAASTKTAKKWIKPGGPEVLYWLGALTRLADLSPDSSDILSGAEEVCLVEHVDYQ